MGITAKKTFKVKNKTALTELVEKYGDRYNFFTIVMPKAIHVYLSRSSKLGFVSKATLKKEIARGKFDTRNKAF